MRLGYNPQTDRIGVLDFDLWQNEGLHCGAGLEGLKVRFTERSE